MVSKRATNAFAAGLSAAAGAAAFAAWQHGLWGALTGALLIVAWMLALTWHDVADSRTPVAAAASHLYAEETVSFRLLLDQVPVPLLSVDANGVRALNRTARALFATDDRVLPVPEALALPGRAQLDHEGRRWRVDRVETHGGAAPRAVLALIDVEAEARSAEARVSAEMIQVLGHELLNGLAPIVSLAESGTAAVIAPAPNMDLLAEILTTLARRTEGLLRFAEAYRALARLPEPASLPVDTKEVADDLALLFAGRWAAVPLSVNVSDAVTVSGDRDQITQAIWSLLQNGAEAALSASAQPSVLFAITRRGNEAVVSVQDNGGGISPDDIGRIFRPFHTTKPLGTGVGLSLARQIARAHGGDLTLSRPRPTTFELTLPLN